MHKLTDKLITAFDNGLRTLFAQPMAQRPRPDDDIPDVTLSPSQKKHVVALMRINHVGEICAQALYTGQALVSHSPETVKTLREAANEEIDHLAWCEARINELGGRVSLLNPIWYAGSFALGSLAGLAGDRWNLGFLAETEQQVEQHLQGHLHQIPAEDKKTHTILAQMQADEHEHAKTAQELGAEDLPTSVKFGMKLASKIMKSTAYYV